ncbi:MAG: 4'-phosphopantetheinyl transferase superfamily protein, partial [Candidatus Andersenbacteria bacterium]|nr:4'-phosphopantetheinyl transferase superfamily protein [Candidatus Andersenbacteria bacterium]
MVERPKIGIGVDMESVARFERFVQRPGHRFLQHAFLQSERYYCFSRLAAAQHLAARWAGKEAVIKALSA